MSVDRAGFDAAMGEQKAAARAAWKGSGEKASEELWFDLLDRFGATEFTGYVAEEGEGEVLAIVREGAEVEAAQAGEAVEIVVNQTPFYAESGGQVGDAGTLTSADGAGHVIEDAKKHLGRLFAHRVTLAGPLRTGDVVRLEVDHARRSAIRANHSATHLLHAALRERLGNHVAQKGSLVAPDRLRFDVSHHAPIAANDLAVVEADVNAMIRQNGAVTTKLMTPEDAIAEGAMALFGEKYGDEVRVVGMGETAAGTYSVELCGGTHVRALGDIGLFKLVGESGVSSGVRRVEALTGEAARAWFADRDAKLREAAVALKAQPEDVPARVVALLEDRRRLERELAEAKKALALGGGRGEAASSAIAAETAGGVAFASQVIDGLDPKELRGLADEAKARLGSGVVVLVATNEGRAAVVVGVTDDLHGRLSAVDLVKRAVAALGGQGGGGRPDLAQGGGPDAAKAGDAVDAVRAALAESAVAA